MLKRVTMVANHATGELYSVSHARSIRSQKCVAIATRTGEPCERWALRGSDHCIRHDPDQESLEKSARVSVGAAQIRMELAAEEIVEKLIAVALSDEVAPYVAMKAGQLILDRVGLPARQHLTIESNVTVNDDAVSLIRERLGRLAEGLQPRTGTSEQDAEDQLAIEASGPVLDPGPDHVV